MRAITNQNRGLYLKQNKNNKNKNRFLMQSNGFERANTSERGGKYSDEFDENR